MREITADEITETVARLIKVAESQPAPAAEADPAEA